MSFRLEAVVPKGYGWMDAYRTIRDSKVEGQDELPRERKEVILSASEAVADIISQGSLGSNDLFGFKVVVSGHVNPDHKPQEGSATDFVQISIMQVKE